MATRLKLAAFARLEMVTRLRERRTILVVLVPAMLPALLALVSGVHCCHMV